jgi:hypothetical protein
MREKNAMVVVIGEDDVNKKEREERKAFSKDTSV